MGLHAGDAASALVTAVPVLLAATAIAHLVATGRLPHAALLGAQFAVVIVMAVPRAANDHLIAGSILAVLHCTLHVAGASHTLNERLLYIIQVLNADCPAVLCARVYLSCSMFLAPLCCLARCTGDVFCNTVCKPLNLVRHAGTETMEGLMCKIFVYDDPDSPCTLPRLLDVQSLVHKYL